MQITDKMRAEVRERAGRRCECLSENCRHHRKGARCPKVLRDGDWKIYYRRASAGAALWNLEAWCSRCFDNNYPQGQRG
jgi:5-methylcytosine-specific restriction endonuclease McrA